MIYIQKDKRIPTLIELAECVLKNNIFEHNLLFCKQLRGTAIGAKMATPYRNYPNVVRTEKELFLSLRTIIRIKKIISSNCAH